MEKIQENHLKAKRNNNLYRVAIIIQLATVLSLKLKFVVCTIECIFVSVCDVISV